MPPTESTHSAVGVLFLLVSSHGQWHISDRLQFLATGKYAEVKCELTSGTGVGYHLGTEGHRPIVTITEQQGGRGYTYLVSASYTYAATNLKRLNLE